MELCKHKRSQCINQFTINSVRRTYTDHVTVIVSIDAKLWAKAKAKGQLGELYGIDISNAVFREYGVKAYMPSVSDRRRASKGIKRIELTYLDASWREAPDNVIKVDFIKKLIA